MALAKWDTQWETHTHEGHLRSKTMDKYNGLSRSTCATLIQIRTGKTGLNDFLCSINRAETDRCDCRGGFRQPPDHVLTVYSKYSDLRNTCCGREREYGHEDVLSEPATAKRAAIFMARTGLLGKLGKACLVDVDAEASK